MAKLRDIISRGGFLRGRNWVAILLSVALAAAIWLIVNLSGTYSGIITVPVRAVSNIDGHSETSSGIVTVTAICRTDGFRLLTRERKSPVTVRFQSSDLHQKGPEVFFIAGSAKNSYIQSIFGDNAVVEAFVTDTLEFTFPLQHNIRVPVEPVMDLGFRPQYMATSRLKVSPDSVTIYGEASRIDGIERVTTSQLRMTDIHQSQQGMLRINAIKGVRMSAQEVTYSLDVDRYVEVRSTLPVEVWNNPAGHHLQVFPSQAEVVLRCRFPVRKDPLKDFRVYIDYKDYASSLTGRCIAHTLRLPENVLECRIEPQVFDCIETE